MDFTDHTTVVAAIIISNLVALVMLWLSWKKPSAARLLFFLLFCWAGITNISTALHQPEVYLEYAAYALIPFYKDFILGFFSQHITAFVFAIGICQLLIAVTLTLKGTLFKLGCAGGILFLLAILPLGFGSGSPAPLWWAIALFILYKKRSTPFLWSGLTNKRN